MQIYSCILQTMNAQRYIGDTCFPSAVNVVCNESTLFELQMRMAWVFNTCHVLIVDIKTYIPHKSFH